MRVLRHVLVLLLVLLLPLRGAQAAVSACAPDGDAPAPLVHVAHVGQAPQGVATRADDAGGGAAHDCSCDACCSFTALPGAAPKVHAPATAARARIARPAAAVPHFIAEGPERPPRSI